MRHLCHKALGMQQVASLLMLQAHFDHRRCLCCVLRNLKGMCKGAAAAEAAEAAEAAAATAAVMCAVRARRASREGHVHTHRIVCIVPDGACRATRKVPVPDRWMQTKKNV